ncbi:MAG: FAD-binding domain-containing protein, partial [Alphaproteobacteria bacterium]
DLKDAKVEVRSGSASLLVEPWEVQTAAGGAYKVFTPFCRAARDLDKPLDPLPAPGAAPAWPEAPEPADALGDWALRPTAPDWAGGLRETWEHGEAAAIGRLEIFVASALRGYAAERDRPGVDGVSMLSPYLRFGEIGPRQARAAALAAEGAGTAFEAFERELYWRDFCCNQLFHADDLANDNVQPRFDAFPWRDAPAEFDAWRRGRTGYPIVDAGMRQLWHTGWMHNRVRMITASFLTKHLLIDWRAGESWFW